MPRDLLGARIVVVGDWPPPLGGVSVHVRALRDAARRAGARVSVLDIGRGTNRADGVVPGRPQLRFAAGLLRLCSGADLVHVHTSGANPKSWAVVAATGLAARVLHCRALVTLHSGHGPLYLVTPGRVLAARLALQPFDRVVCVNEEIARTLQRVGAAPGRHVVAPAFGREGLHPGPLPAAVAAFRNEHPQLVSAMLAPGRDYGAPELFAAFARLRRTHPRAGLVVYGPGTDSSSVRALAEEAGASPVLLLGEVERADALAVMDASRAFVRPTRVDGDAVSVREALALGVPVAATRVGTRPDGVVLCPPGDAEALARAVETALGAERARGRVQDGIETVLRLYARLLGPRRPAVRAA